MGQSRTYICNICGYSVESSGGHDIGMMAVIDTYICTDCKEIVEVLVGQYGETFIPDPITGEVTQNKDFDYYKCPECKSGTHLVLWNKRNKPCPKCDGRMKVDPFGPFTDWD